MSHNGNGKTPTNLDGHGAHGNQYPPGAVVGVPFSAGADARRGGGKKGRSGRPSNEARAKSGKILKRGHAEHAAVVILRNPNHPHWFKTYALHMAYKYGPPRQQLDVNVSNIESLSDEELINIIAGRAPKDA